MADLQDQLAEPVILAVGDREHVGWTEVSVTRAIDRITGTFALSLVPRDDSPEAADSEPDAGEADGGETDGGDVDVAQGDRCQVLVGDEVVIDGWIDAVTANIDGRSRSVQVTGRDRTGDLADCSAVHKPASWRKTTLGTIARALVEPFGITVVIDGDDPKVDRFALQQGEHVQEALERLVRFQGLLMLAGPDGDLLFTTPSKDAPVALLKSGDYLTASAAFDLAERYSDYIVKGQAAGSDDRNGRAAAQLTGKATDAGITRHRPLLIIAEDQGSGASMQARAEWEAGVRRGRGTTITITLPGWRPAAGEPVWRPNSRVQIDIPKIGMGGGEELLVTAVSFSKSDAGTTTTLTLMPPDAWRPLKAGAA